MTILQEVLTEEYVRLANLKTMYLDILKEESKGTDRWKHYKRRIREVKADMRRIRRAMGFQLFPAVKRFRNEKDRQRRTGE